MVTVPSPVVKLVVTDEELKIMPLVALRLITAPGTAAFEASSARIVKVTMDVPFATNVVESGDNNILATLVVAAGVVLAGVVTAAGALALPPPPPQAAKTQERTKTNR